MHAHLRALRPLLRAQRLIECHRGGGAAAKYTSDSYDILRCNCNHFTEDLCMAVCGKQVRAGLSLVPARSLSPSVVWRFWP